MFAPSLTIEGEKTQIPLDATESWAQASPDCRLLLVPDAGHMNWIDQPEFVVGASDEFCAAISQRRHGGSRQSRGRSG